MKEHIMDIAIVTDSTCDIPDDLAEEYQVHIVPNILVIDGVGVEDGKGFSRREFYQRLPEMKTLPTTSTASSGTYYVLYEKIFKEGFSQILSIHASSLLSGIYNAASAAAKAFGKRVCVIDSQQVSMGLGFQVLEAAEAIRQGLKMDEILGRIEGIRQRIRLVAMLDTLEYVRRSGRVSWARASLGSLLHIKPFVEVKNGIVQRLGEVRTRAKGMARLLEMLHNLGPLERLAILHSNAEEDAKTLLSNLRLMLSTPPLLVNVTTIIGTHVGPNGLGFVAVVKYHS